LGTSPQVFFYQILFLKKKFNKNVLKIKLCPGLQQSGKPEAFQPALSFCWNNLFIYLFCLVVGERERERDIHDDSTYVPTYDSMPFAISIGQKIGDEEHSFWNKEHLC
jgi:hypothetical protein